MTKSSKAFPTKTAMWLIASTESLPPTTSNEEILASSPTTLDAFHTQDFV
jgi:hypothetical protein